MVVNRLLCELGSLYASLLLLPGKLYGDADYLEERHRHRFEVRI